MGFHFLNEACISNWKRLLPRHENCANCYDVTSDSINFSKASPKIMASSINREKSTILRNLTKWNRIGLILLLFLSASDAYGSPPRGMSDKKGKALLATPDTSPLDSTSTENKATWQIQALQDPSGLYTVVGYLNDKKAIRCKGRAAIFQTTRGFEFMGTVTSFEKHNLVSFGGPITVLPSGKVAAKIGTQLEGAHIGRGKIVLTFPGYSINEMPWSDITVLMPANDLTLSSPEGIYSVKGNSTFREVDSPAKYQGEIVVVSTGGYSKNDLVSKKHRYSVLVNMTNDSGGEMFFIKFASFDEDGAAIFEKSNDDVISSFSLDLVSGQARGALVKNVNELTQNISIVGSKK